MHYTEDGNGATVLSQQTEPDCADTVELTAGHLEDDAKRVVEYITSWRVVGVLSTGIVVSRTKGLDGLQKKLLVTTVRDTNSNGRKEHSRAECPDAEHH